MALLAKAGNQLEVARYLETNAVRHLDSDDGVERGLDEEFMQFVRHVPLDCNPPTDTCHDRYWGPKAWGDGEGELGLGATISGRRTVIAQLLQAQ